MSVAGMVIHDARQLSTLQVPRAELAVLAERGERRRLAPARSVYLALLEGAGGQAWTLKAISERAGVGAEIVKEVLTLLRALGYLRDQEDGSLQIVSPGGAEISSEPVVKVMKSAHSPELTERAERFFAAHARVRSGTLRGGRGAGQGGRQVEPEVFRFDWRRDDLSDKPPAVKAPF